MVGITIHLLLQSHLFIHIFVLLNTTVVHQHYSPSILHSVSLMLSLVPALVLFSSLILHKVLILTSFLSVTVAQFFGVDKCELNCEESGSVQGQVLQS